MMRLRNGRREPKPGCAAMVKKSTSRRDDFGVPPAGASEASTAEDRSHRGALAEQIVMLRDDVPIRSRIEADTGPADQAGAVHQPHRGRAVMVLPENVGLAVGIV